jgi:protein Mpv17
MLGRVSKAVQNHRMLASIGVSTGVAVVSDGLAQAIEQRSEQNTTFDASRAGAMGLWGFIGAPVGVLWFQFLDRKYPPSKHLGTVLKKVAINQLTMGALVAAAFLGYMSIRNEQGTFLQNWRARMSTSFIPLFTHGMVYWSSAHAVNFYFIPPHLRVIYQSVAGLVWTMYLSWEGHRPLPATSPR